MRTLATKQPKNDFTKQQKIGDKEGRSRSVFALSTGMPLLQRQCACGGGCPRCQDELGIQTKLKIGEPGDKYEQEADRIADQVSPSDSNAQTSLESQLNRTKGSGSPLPDAVRSFMEPRFGDDFSGVRVHTSSDAVQMNEALNAQAFTHNQDVYFGAGKAPAKDALTAHELTHVVQQSAFSTANSVQELQIVPDDLYSETEANTVAMRFANAKSVGQSFSKYPQVIQRQPKTGKCSNAARQNCTDEDLLTAICIGETGNVKDRDGKKGVMNVVMNRVRDGGFGTDIRKVATASGQFHGLANGINLLNNPSFADCRPLAQEVIADPSNDPTSGAVFFDQSCAKPCEQYCTVYLGDGKTGAHYFARRATPSEKKECQNKKTNPSGRNRYCCDNPKQRVYILPLIEIVGSANAEKNGEEEIQDTTP